MGSYKTAVCGGAHCKCMGGRLGGCENWHNGDHTCPISKPKEVEEHE